MSCSKIKYSKCISNWVQELSELVESPPPGIKVELADESDIYKWKVYMEGPEGSPYQVRHETRSAP